MEAREGAEARDAALALLRRESGLLRTLLKGSRYQHGSAVYFRKLSIAQRSVGRLCAEVPPDPQGRRRAEALLHAAFLEFEHLLSTTYFMPLALVCMASIARVCHLCGLVWPDEPPGDPAGRRVSPCSAARHEPEDLGLAVGVPAEEDVGLVAPAAPAEAAAAGPPAAMATVPRRTRTALRPLRLKGLGRAAWLRHRRLRLAVLVHLC